VEKMENKIMKDERIELTGFNLKIKGKDFVLTYAEIFKLKMELEKVIPTSPVFIPQPYPVQPWIKPYDRPIQPWTIPPIWCGTGEIK